MSKTHSYQKYLNGELDERGLIAEVERLDAHVAKEGGVVYTPEHIVDHMIKMANISLHHTIMEPSCGHGVFLLGLLKHAEQTWGVRAEQLLHWFVNNVTAIEINTESVDDVRHILSAFFKRRHNMDVSHIQFHNIHLHDALTYQVDQTYDVCIGNPPYIRAKHLSKEYLEFLKKHFVSCQKGTIDIYYAFIERFQKTCRNLVFITPNSFLTNKSGAALKNMIVQNISVLIDFKEQRVFPDASVYTCIFHLDNCTNNPNILYGNAVNTLSWRKKDDVFAQPVFSNDTTPTVLSGTATLADSVFLVKKINGHYTTQFDGVDYPIEEGAVVPYMKITKIRDRVFLPTEFMIHPYLNDKKIIDEACLKQRFPNTYAFLCAAKERLNQRDKGKTEKYEAWYAYGRKQGIHRYAATTWVVVPQMIGGASQPMVVDVTDVLKKFPTITFTSGFVVPLVEGQEQVIMQLLGPDFVAYYKQHGKPWPGKTEAYYSLNVGHIKRFLQQTQNTSA